MEVPLYSASEPLPLLVRSWAGKRLYKEEDGHEGGGTDAKSEVVKALFGDERRFLFVAAPLVRYSKYLILHYYVLYIDIGNSFWNMGWLGVNEKAAGKGREPRRNRRARPFELASQDFSPLQTSSPDIII